MRRFRGKKGIVLVALLLTVTAQAQDTLRLDLNNALEIAMSKSPTIQLAGKDITKKEYAKKETIAQLFPTFSATGTYSHTIEKMSFAIMGEVIKAGTSNQAQGGFNLALPLYAPTLYHAIQINGTDVQLALEASRASKIDLVNQVTKAYYQLLLAQDSYRVLLKSYNQAEANYNVVHNKYKQGAVSEYDDIRAEVQVRNLKPSVISAENAINLTKMQLQVLIGMDVAQPIAIEGNLSDYEGGMYSDVLSADTTLVNNSDLKQLELQTEMLQRMVKMNQANFLPTLSLSAQYSWMTMSEDLKIKDYKWNPYSTIGLTLNIPIINMANVYKVKQSRIDLEKMNFNELNLRRSLKLQVSNYMDNMQKSVEQIESNKESIKQAEKGRMIAQKRYDIGSGTILELNDSEVALTQSQLTYNQSIFDYLSAKADLEKVLGKKNQYTK